MSYVMAGQLSELERLLLQSRVWEPAGERFLAELGDGSGLRVLDVGCGCLGWLRILSRWVGDTGSVTGSDNAPEMIHRASELVAKERLVNVEVVHDDLFASTLPQRSFDVVHARFQLAPLGRMVEQLTAYRRLVAPGGTLVLEDPDTRSWGYTPTAPALERLIGLVLGAFTDGGGDFDAGRREFQLLRDLGLEPQLRAEVVALEPGHPYLRLPVQFAASLRPRLLRTTDDADLTTLLAACETELASPDRYGLTFTLIQTWAVVP